MRDTGHLIPVTSGAALPGEFTNSNQVVQPRSYAQSTCRVNWNGSPGSHPKARFCGTCSPSGSNESREARQRSLYLLRCLSGQ